MAELDGEQVYRIRDVRFSNLDSRFLAGVITGGLVGFGTGYFVSKRLWKKRWQQHFAQVEELEIKIIKGEYKMKLEEMSKNPPVNLVAPKPALKDLAVELGYEQAEQQAIDEVEEEMAAEEAEKHNVFVDAEVDPDTGAEVWNYQTEVASRSATEPYVLHKDEFFNDERDYEQTTISYFAEDDILCDERDDIIDDPDGTVGLVNLDKFGHGSGDPNIVYVRNDKLGMEFEIIKNDTSYTETVHGFVKHSAYEPRRRGHPKFDDE